MAIVLYPLSYLWPLTQKFLYPLRHSQFHFAFYPFKNLPLPAFRNTIATWQRIVLSIENDPFMKRFLNVVAFSFIAINSFAADNTVTNDSLARQNEQLYQRFVKEMQQKMQEMQKMDPSNLDLSFTNAEAQSSLRAVFESAIVDPSFGLEWDEVPAPTLVGPEALSAVNSFVATNGWNIQTNDCIFDCISDDDNQAKSKPIRGLPWAAIHEQEFPAVTHGGV